MKKFQCLVLTIYFLYSTGISHSELIIAWPETEKPEEQNYEAFFIKTPSTVQAKARQIVPPQQFSVPLLRESGSPTVQTPTESKSFNIFGNQRLLKSKNTNENSVAERSDKNGVTITIRVNPNGQVNQNTIQGTNSHANSVPAQGTSNSYLSSLISPNSYLRSIPSPSSYLSSYSSPTNYLTSPIKSFNNMLIKNSNGLAEALTDGIIVSKPKPTESPSTFSIFNSVPAAETTMLDASGFFKDLSNLIKSQVSSVIDSALSKDVITDPGSHPFEQESQQSPQYAFFTPITNLLSSPTTTPKPSSFLSPGNVANFLTQQILPTKSEKEAKPSIGSTLLHIAKPIPTMLSYLASSSSSEASSDHSPMYTAASTVMKTVSKIPGNLDSMFNDMGRVYRKNLFKIRDKIVDMRSFIPSIGSGSSKKKENKKPWLDAFGV